MSSIDGSALCLHPLSPFYTIHGRSFRALQTNAEKEWKKTE
jgi:hypothetical protein